MHEYFRRTVEIVRGLGVEIPPNKLISYRIGIEEADKFLAEWFRGVPEFIEERAAILQANVGVDKGRRNYLTTYPELAIVCWGIGNVRRIYYDVQTWTEKIFNPLVYRLAEEETLGYMEGNLNLLQPIAEYSSRSRTGSNPGEVRFKRRELGMLDEAQWQVLIRMGIVIEHRENRYWAGGRVRRAFCFLPPIYQLGSMVEQIQRIKRGEGSLELIGEYRVEGYPPLPKY